MFDACWEHNQEDAIHSFLNDVKEQLTIPFA